MPRPRRYDAAVRDRLLKDAARIAATEGPSALSARRLATESGTTTAAIYTLFGGMDSLRAALTAQSLSDLGRSQREVPETDSVTERLLSLGAAYRGWALEHPHEYRSIFSDALGLAARRADDGASSEPSVPVTAPEAFLASVDDASQWSLEPLHAAVTEGLESGKLTGPGDAGQITTALWATLHGLISLELVGVLQPRLEQMGAHGDPSDFFLSTMRQFVGALTSPRVHAEAPAHVLPAPLRA